jgi:hypothetical protein
MNNPPDVRGRTLTAACEISRVHCVGERDNVMIDRVILDED